MIVIEISSHEFLIVFFPLNSFLRHKASMTPLLLFNLYISALMSFETHFNLVNLADQFEVPLQRSISILASKSSSVCIICKNDLCQDIAWWHYVPQRKNSNVFHSKFLKGIRTKHLCGRLFRCENEFGGLEFYMQFVLLWSCCCLCRQPFKCAKGKRPLTWRSTFDIRHLRQRNPWLEPTSEENLVLSHILCVREDHLVRFYPSSKFARLIIGYARY